MRNAAMQQLDVLVGEWDTTLTNAWFLEPSDQEVPGSATVEWVGEAFIVLLWTMQGDVGAATSEQVVVLGRSDARDEFAGRWEASQDRGATWRKDFDLTFARRSPEARLAGAPSRTALRRVAVQG